MIPPTFHIGDEVIITGPTITGCKLHAGEKFTISWESNGDYTGKGYPWYPASSLQLAEPELKIGDWVEVLVDGCGKKKGFIFCIEYIKDETYSSGPIRYYSANKLPMWPKDELRKLTPEEIKQHTNPGKQYPITPAKDFDELTLRDVARMAGICKNEYGVWISTLLKRAHETEDRLSAIEKRLDFVEKFQREQAEATQYRRNMLWMAGP